MTDPLQPSEGEAVAAYEITDLDGFLSELRKVLEPRFAEEREAWEQHGPAVTDRAARLGITLDSLGGNCPVQAEGSFDSHRFHYRARGDEWQFHVWKAERATKCREMPFGEEAFLIERDYGDGPYDAGWMPRHEALGFICDGVEEFRAGTIGAA